MISPIIGLVATLAPTIGPTIGGYLTDLFSWHWLFLVNVVPGIMVTAAAYFLIDFDQPDLKLLKNFDWLGLLLHGRLARRLEYVLEEGPSDDWFQDDADPGAGDPRHRCGGAASSGGRSPPNSRSSTCAPSPTATSPPAASSA